MAETLSNANMESLLTILIESVKDIRAWEDVSVPGDRLNMLITDLEDVTSDLKSCQSDWKTATQQAEDGAKKVAEKSQQLEEREKQMKIEQQQLERRRVELETNEKMFEERRAELEKQEKLLQQQSANLEQTDRNCKHEQARLQTEATVIESAKSEVQQAQIKLEARTDAAEQVERANNQRSNELREREATIKFIHNSALAWNENVNKNLAALKEDRAALKEDRAALKEDLAALKEERAVLKEELDEDKQVKAAILEKHRRMKKSRDNLLSISQSCTTQYRSMQTSLQDLVNFEDGERQTLAGLRVDMTSLSTALNEQAQEAKGIAKEIDVAEKNLRSLVTSTERQLLGLSTNIGKLSTNIGNVTEASAELNEVSSKIGNVTEISSGLDEVSSKIGNVTEVSTGLDEVSAKIQQLKPTVTATIGELTGSLLKVRADNRRIQEVDYSASRFSENLAKRILGPASPEKPISKRRRHARQRSVGSAEMLTSVERPEPLPADILDTVPSPRGQGRLAVVDNQQRGNDASSPVRRPFAATRTPSGGHGLLRSSVGSQSALHSQPSSLIDPATATAERSSQSAMIPSSQSGASTTDIPALSDASDEVKQVWAHIEFPANWDAETSKLLLAGLNKNTGRKTPPRYRPAGLLNLAATQTICLRRKLAKTSPALDNGDAKCCSDCKARKIQCISVTFVAEGLANVDYDPDSEEKRWKLTIREV